MVLFRIPTVTFPRRKGIHLGKTINYGGSDISVSDEIAEFLENDRKRQSAEERSDRRHISKSESETVSANATQSSFDNPTLCKVIKILMLEKLRTVMLNLSFKDKTLIYFYFYCNDSMEKIGEFFNVSKMAISKRLKKLLSRMRKSMET